MEGLIHRLDTETLRGDDLRTIKAIIRIYPLVIQCYRTKNLDQETAEDDLRWEDGKGG